MPFSQRGWDVEGSQFPKLLFTTLQEMHSEIVVAILSEL